MLSDPIAALATPPGRSAIAVVRLSGVGAFEVAARVVDGFRPDRPRVATLATFRDAAGDVIDRGLVTVFPAPAQLHRRRPGRALLPRRSPRPRPAARGPSCRRRPAGRAGRIHPPRGAQRQARPGAGRGGGRPDRRGGAGPGPGRPRASSTAGSRAGSRIFGRRWSRPKALLAYEIDFPGEDDGPIPPQRIAAQLAGRGRPPRAAAGHGARRRAAPRRARCWCWPGAPTPASPPSSTPCSAATGPW